MRRSVELGGLARLWEGGWAATRPLPANWQAPLPRPLVADLQCAYMFVQTDLNSGGKGAEDQPALYYTSFASLSRPSFLNAGAYS